MKENLEDFVLYLVSEKGLSTHSIEAYQRDVSVFLDWLADCHVLDLNQVTQPLLVNFMEWLQLKEFASASIVRKMVSLKVFWKFLVREQVVNVNVASLLDTPKLWQMIPDVLSEEEMLLLLQQPDKTTFLGSRDAAIMEILYASGLRVSELCQLNIYDVSDEQIKVMGKGGRERVVPVGKKAIECLDDYLNKFRSLEVDPKQKALFLTQKGKRIDRITVWKRIKQYALQASIVKVITPHTFRHSFATHLLDRGASLRVIQEMLGHVSIATTDRYTHISRSKIQKEFEQCHPRNSV